MRMNSMWGEELSPALQEITEKIEIWLLGINLVDDKKWKVVDVIRSGRYAFEIRKDWDTLFRIIRGDFENYVTVEVLGKTMDINPLKLEGLKKYRFSKIHRSKFGETGNFNYWVDLKITAKNTTEMIEILSLYEPYIIRGISTM